MTDSHAPRYQPNQLADFLDRFRFKVEHDDVVPCVQEDRPVPAAAEPAMAGLPVTEAIRPGALQPPPPFAHPRFPRAVEASVLSSTLSVFRSLSAVQNKASLNKNKNKDKKKNKNKLSFSKI